MNNHYQNARNYHAYAIKLLSAFNTTDIMNHPQNLRPQKMKGNIKYQDNISFFGP